MSIMNYIMMRGLKDNEMYTDKYLFMANCTMVEFYNFLLRKWRNKNE